MRQEGPEGPREASFGGFGHIEAGGARIGQAWKRHFDPEYEGTERHWAVTSQYGRHRVVSCRRVERDVSRKLTRYVRGNTSAGGIADPTSVIDHDSHGYYEAIEPLYRKRIYKPGV